MKRLSRALVFVLLAVCVGPAGAADAPTLRVCSDPNNLPFSNRARAGFEDALADWLARELGLTVQHVYWAQRRGFIRNTLKAGKCDVVLGVPSTMDSLLTTRPYYRSSYVFVTRGQLGKPVRSLDDPRLRHLRVGVPVVGDDYANPPPAHALARRGIVDNVVGFSVFGDYRQDSPPLGLVRAVERGTLDVAIAWGPAAGYVAQRSGGALQLAPVSPTHDGPYPFVYDISMGVRHGDTARKAQLDDVLLRGRKQVEELLHAYGVPLL